MRTADSVSPSLTGSEVVISLFGYAVVYLVMFPAGVALMARIVGRGPAEAIEPEPIEGGLPGRPHPTLPSRASEAQP